MKKIQDIAKEGKRQKGENGKHYDALKETREFFRKYNDERLKLHWSEPSRQGNQA